MKGKAMAVVVKLVSGTTSSGVPQGTQASDVLSRKWLVTRPSCLGCLGVSNAQPAREP